MKKIFSFVLLFIFVFFNINFLEVNAIRIVKNPYEKPLKSEINFKDMFLFFGKKLDIPESYKYINLNINVLSGDLELKDSLKKLVYKNLIKNSQIKLNPYKKVNAYSLYSFAEKFYNTSFINDSQISELKSRKAIFGDFYKIDSKIKNISNTFEIEDKLEKIKIQKQIFSDVYKTLLNNHYDKDKLDKVEMIREATKGLAKATKDKHTVYFPPTDNKNFKDSLSGEYEGIGAYVEMQEPGVFKIVSPIGDSPAEKAGLKGGDRVTHVDKKEITEKVSLAEAVSWIKGPAGTDVTLTIKRGTKVFDVVVKRAKIILKEVESKKIGYNTLYVEMKFFGDKISSEFKQNLEILKTDKNIKKIIFDLRGNGGGYLDQVADMLGYFVEKGKGVAVVKYSNGNEFIYKSRGYKDFDFSKYKIIILQNGGTASASEIFIGTLKDYYPNITIIGEQSYGKGSVQTIKQYSDGSSLKYTIAHWFTGKNKIGINGVGISPDIKIEMEKYGVEERNDKQLQKALKL